LTQRSTHTRASAMLVKVLQGMALEAPSFKVVEVEFSLKV
jgi:hypothetical protein